jgi:hypothetical protein
METGSGREYTAPPLNFLATYLGEKGTKTSPAPGALETCDATVEREVQNSE